MKFKKAILGLLSLTIISATGLTTFANGSEILKLDDEMLTIMPIYEELDKFQFNSFTGKITEIREHDTIEGKKYVLVENEEGGIAHIVLSKDTYILNGAEIKLGDTITGYYDGNAPMIMIYPAQYNAEVVIVNGEENVKVDMFNEELISSDHMLKLNITNDTKIVLEDGTKFEGELANRKLVVTYGASTKSIPAQTTPNQIVVLFEEEQPSVEIPEENETEILDDIASMNIIVENNKVETPSAYANKNGTIMVPIRVIAEALGSKLEWNNELRSVMIDKGISFKIGENNYTYMKTAPIELESSPELVDGITYVPLNFFTKVMGTNNAYVFENQIVIDNGEIMN